jgi:hypothetical protein
MQHENEGYYRICGRQILVMNIVMFCVIAPCISHVTFGNIQLKSYLCMINFT